ncbi:MAG: alpha/beta hydrolase [Williamsia sp.]|nr:alpha/beta hydrolase [Williamsia sp.]
MKKRMALFCLISLPVVLWAQSTTGITGKRDTSYSNYSAYNSTRKTHPDIRLVPELKSSLVAEKKDIEYCKRGERSLYTDAFYPASQTGAPHPAILIIHGGGWRSGNRTQHHPLAQHLAALGYVCFTPEYRLSTEALYPAAVYDLKAVLRWVRAHAATYHIDTARIAVLGFSAGGELAAFLGTTNGMARFEGEGCQAAYSSRVQAVVDLDGILSFVHPESGEGNDSLSTSAATYWFGYPKKANGALWQDASSLTHAGPQTPPFLFINSSVARMHAGRDDFRQVLDRYKIYSEVHSFDGAPHSFPLFDPWFEPMLQYIDGFLVKVFGRR